jgi:hypothetical protein
VISVSEDPAEVSVQVQGDLLQGDDVRVQVADRVPQQSVPLIPVGVGRPVGVHGPDPQAFPRHTAEVFQSPHGLPQTGFACVSGAC